MNRVCIVSGGGGGLTYKINYEAIVVAYHTDPKVESNNTWAGSNNFGVVTNSLYINKGGYGGGNAHSEGIFVGWDWVNKKPYRGFTGDINGAKFIDGICVGIS